MQFHELRQLEHCYTPGSVPNKSVAIPFVPRTRILHPSSRGQDSELYTWRERKEKINHA